MAGLFEKLEKVEEFEEPSATAGAAGLCAGLIRIVEHYSNDLVRTLFIQ